MRTTSRSSCIDSDSLGVGRRFVFVRIRDRAGRSAIMALTQVEEGSLFEGGVMFD